MTNDPIHDFLIHDAEQYEALERLPVCCVCQEHIQDEYGYYINEEWYCEDCMKGFRESVEVD